MANPIGFWSYVHQDDDDDFGRIVELGRDVVAGMRMATGESVEIFLDRDSLSWGQRWRSIVDEGLAQVAFFIPVLTPRYFDSAECRRETRTFAQQAKDLGVTELIMPLLYVDVPVLHADSPTDDLAVLMKDFQWEDWRELRFEERPSKAYRLGVNKLVQRLVEANVEAERSASTAKVSPPRRAAGSATAQPNPKSPAETADDDDQPGTLDLIAQGEAAMPLWGAVLEAIGSETVALASVFEKGSASIAQADARGAGAAGRIRVAREVSHDLEPIAERFTSLANDYVSQMYDVDAGIRALIDGAGDQADDLNTDDLASVCGLFAVIREFHGSVTEALSSAREMAASMEPMEKMSRDLRKPLRVLRRALTMMDEAQGVVGQWTAMIDASPVVCPADA